MGVKLLGQPNTSNTKIQRKIASNPPPINILYWYAQTVNINTRVATKAVLPNFKTYHQKV